MPAVISLLRGINLGAHHRISMDALRGVYESLGLEDVKTYVQSGNVVFRSRAKNFAPLAARIEQAIEDKFGFRSAVILRTAADFEEVISANPFAGRDGIDPARLLVTFLSAEPAPTARAGLAALPSGSEEVHLRGREVYAYFPDGVGRPKVPYAVVEKIIGVPGTARNWNTVTRLLDIARSL